MSRRPLRRNFIVNLLYPSVRIAVAFVTIPIYLRHVGEARYGVISIVWILLGLFGFLDLGLSRAVTNALAKLRDAPQAERARVLLTTFGLNLGIGLVGGAVLYVFGGLLLKHFISVPAALSPEVSQSLPWIACLLPLTLVSSAAAGALDSRELFLLVNLIQTVSMTFRASRAGDHGGIRQPLAHGRYSHRCGRAGVRRDHCSDLRLPPGRAILASRDRLGRGAEAARLWQLDVRHQCDQPRAGVGGSIYHWLGDGRRLGCALRRADESCLAERSHPMGVRAHVLSPHVQPVRRCGLRAWSARAVVDGVWLRRHLRSGDHPVADLLPVLGRP